MTLSKIADMHTHSENSHDSVCKIEDMLKSQAEKGMEFFAVTDHFDTYSYMDYDIFTPIQRACDEADRLNKIHNGNPLVLRGFEISEGFWHPEIQKKILEMTEYDVIIGSVHCVRYKDLTCAYAQIDFSALSSDNLFEYLDAYFDDVLTLIDTTDFDILGHLTCPLRYIKGKYKIDIDMSPYEKKIEKILNLIIQREISLEVNTSSFDLLNAFMPYYDIIKKYYDLGGYLITLGSDAHIPQNASINFDKAIETLKNIGFKNIYYYKNRKAIPLAI